MFRRAHATGRPAILTGVRARPLTARTPWLASWVAYAVLTLGVLSVLTGDLTLLVTRHHADSSAPAQPGGDAHRRGKPLVPVAGPREPGLPTSATRTIRATGRGHGLVRLIPCYTVTSGELAHILGRPMALVGQRAAGENGTGLSGTAREDCFWFSTQPDGPYVVLSDVTTAELRGRHGMSGWTARKYFGEVPPLTRTYLARTGDAAYAYGPGEVAVLVGDVYLDVKVVTDDGHPLRDAVAIARLMARLRTTLSR
jgi:hypothetical protein